MHEVTDAINDDEPYIRGVVDGVANDGPALLICSATETLVLSLVKGSLGNVV